MKTQIDFLKEAVRIAEENPEMEIHFAINSEKLTYENWTYHKIISIKKSLYYEGDGKIMTDMDDIIEHLSYEYDREITEKEARKEMKEFILIYTGA